MVAAELELVGFQERLRLIVGNLVPLELEEDERGLDLGAALLNLLEERPALRIGGVDREPERRIRTRPADLVEDLLELSHRFCQAGGIQL